MWVYSKEVLIKSGMQIAQAGFSFDCMKTTQEYLMYFKEFSGNQAEKCKQDACRDLFGASLIISAVYTRVNRQILENVRKRYTYGDLIMNELRRVDVGARRAAPPL